MKWIEHKCVQALKILLTAIVSLSLENGSYKKGKCTHCTDRWQYVGYIYDIDFCIDTI